MSGSDVAIASASNRRLPLDQLIADVRSCDLCPSMNGRPRVLSRASGQETARCLVIAEAPGATGAGMSGVPLRGDRSGDHFEQLLTGAGIRREDLFITNAVLCSPADPNGDARKPARPEIANCSSHLRRLVDTLQPALVVTLGATALDAIKHIESHEKGLGEDVGTVFRWYSRFVLPLYHPGARAMIRRSWAAQRRDYAEWAALLGKPAN